MPPVETMSFVEVVKVVENGGAVVLNFIFGAMLFYLVKHYAGPTIAAINNVARELGALRAVIEQLDRKNTSEKYIDKKAA